MITHVNKILLSFTRLLKAASLPDTWQTLEHCDVLLVHSDEHCGYTYQGKGYAHLLDSVGDLCINRGLVVRSISDIHSSRMIGVHAYNSPVSCNRSALLIALLRRGARLVTGPANGESWANERWAHLWGRILERAKPRCVIAIQPKAGLCRAGKTKGVPVYDLQHGVIADEHLWYGEKYRKSTPPRDLADCFLCWDEPSAAALRKWAPQKGIDVRVVGNPWFSRFLLPQPTDLLVQEGINDGRIFSNNRPVILVSLSADMDFYYKHKGFNHIMADSLEKTILKTASAYNWLLRLHPTQIRGLENKMATNYLMTTFDHLDSVEWRLCSILPLPVVLQQVDLHITDLSTVVIEAAWMGIRSALININIRPGGSLENIYSHERGLGLAEILPQESNVLEQWIAKTLTKGRGESTLKDASVALHAFIEEIVGGAGTDRKCS